MKLWILTSTRLNWHWFALWWRTTTRHQGTTSLDNLQSPSRASKQVSWQQNADDAPYYKTFHVLDEGLAFDLPPQGTATSTCCLKMERPFRPLHSSLTSVFQSSHEEVPTEDTKTSPVSLKTGKKTEQHESSNDFWQLARLNYQTNCCCLPFQCFTLAILHLNYF